MVIIFRLETRKKSGRGHFNRCLILANLFKKKYKTLFIFNKINSIFKNQLIKNGHAFKELANKKKSEIQKEMDILEEINDKEKVKAIIKDTYYLGSKWEKRIRKKFSLAIIDDRSDQKHHCDLYINYNFSYNYLKQRCNLSLYKKKLLGHKFLIFSDSYKKRRNIRSKSSFFIYMGSVDTKNYCLKTAIFLSKKYPKKKIYLILPEFNYSKGIIEKKFLKKKNVKLISKNLKSLSEYIRNNDFIINSGGTSVYESILLGKKPIVFYQNNFQEKICRYLEKKKLVALCNNINEIKKINFKKKRFKIYNPERFGINGKFKIVKQIENLK